MLDFESNTNAMNWCINPILSTSFVFSCKLLSLLSPHDIFRWIFYLFFWTAFKRQRIIKNTETPGRSRTIVRHQSTLSASRSVFLPLSHCFDVYSRLPRNEVQKTAGRRNKKNWKPFLMYLVFTVLSPSQCITLFNRNNELFYQTVKKFSRKIMNYL